MQLNPDAVAAAAKACGVHTAQVREAVAELATYAVMQRVDRLAQLVASADARAECVAQVQEDIPAGFGLRDHAVDPAVLAAARVLHARQQLSAAA